MIFNKQLLFATLAAVLIISGVIGLSPDTVDYLVESSLQHAREVVKSH